MELPDRLEGIRHRIRSACHRAGRAPDSVRLVAVAKTRSTEEIRRAVDAGVTDLGENRVQEAEAKVPALGRRVRWHLVGHLQKNKVNKAIPIFEMIHSVDSIDLGRRLDRAAAELDKVQSVLVQVDLAGEESKFGLPEKDLFGTIEGLSKLRQIRVDGLMVLPPYWEDPERVRPFFARLRELSARARERGLTLGEELSMGMSHDFEVAIEEGATLVRIGTALFGPRPTPEPIAETNPERGDREMRRG
jgi:PLP dependent protein